MDPGILSGSIDRARAASESAMLDECRMKRPSSGTGTLDPDTGTLTPPAPEVLYEGRCRVSSGGETIDATPRVDAPGAPMRALLKLPAGAGEFRIGDVAELLTVRDPQAVAEGYLERSWRVAGVPTGPWRTEQRVLLEEVDRRG